MLRQLGAARHVVKEITECVAIRLPEAGLSQLFCFCADRRLPNLNMPPFIVDREHVGGG